MTNISHCIEYVNRKSDVFITFLSIVCCWRVIRYLMGLSYRKKRTRSVSRSVSVFPSMALELYVYSTTNSSLSLATSPAVKGLLLSSSILLRSMSQELLFELYLFSVIHQISCFYLRMMITLTLFGKT